MTETAHSVAGEREKFSWNNLSPQDALAMCAHARGLSGLARSEADGGFYLAARYDDVVDVLADVSTFSSWPTVLRPIVPGVPYASANRDPESFEDPDTFSLDRGSNKHVAFGSGPHACAGAPLARLEPALALEVVLRRMPDTELTQAAPPKAFGGASATYIHSLPARSTPGPVLAHLIPSAAQQHSPSITRRTQ